MADDPLTPYSKIVSVRPGRNALPEEDRALADARRRLQKRKQGEDRDDDGQGGYEFGPGHDDIHDDVSVLGIPKEEMTDNVRHAIDILLEEINHLRTELVRAHGHEQYLEQQAEKDRQLHVMRRRAFLARVNLGVQRVADEGVQFSFIYIPITNAATVRGQLGHGAVENLMAQAAEVLREHQVPGDVVGSLEQFDFGVLLPGIAPGEAEVKAQGLVAALAGRSFVWQGQSVAIQAAFGVAEIAPGESAEEVLARAQRDREARAGTGGG